MTVLILGYACCVLLYLGLSVSAPLRARRSLWLIVIALHGTLIGWDTLGELPLIRVGFGQMLSLALCFSVIIFTIEARRYPIENLSLLYFPLAALTCVLPLFFNGFVINTQISGFWLHWFLGIAIFTVFILASVHAIFILLQEYGLRHMHHHHLQNLISRLPPLLVFEKLLHHTIILGFFLLSAGIISGIIIQIETGWVHWLTHKNLFMLIAWLWFGSLLLGALRSAWRGKVLCYGTVIGFAFLFLGYAGSRFILEVILHRNL